MAGDQQYFEPDPSVRSSPSRVELVLPDLTSTLETDRGVFSASRVDPGTKYLLMEAPRPAADVRNALDLGCGYGPIARVLAHRAPGARIWAIDVNSRALELARGNLEGCRVTVATPEAVPDDVTFDLIWSNPPIRIGKAALHSLLETWLGRLSPHGRAVLVVQRHLGADSLSAWLESRGFSTERLGSRRGYRLLDIKRERLRAAPSDPPRNDDGTQPEG